MSEKERVSQALETSLAYQYGLLAEDIVVKEVFQDLAEKIEMGQLSATGIPIKCMTLNAPNDGGCIPWSVEKIMGLDSSSDGWLRKEVLEKLTEDQDGRYSKKFGAGRKVIKKNIPLSCVVAVTVRDRSIYMIRHFICDKVFL